MTRRRHRTTWATRRRLGRRSEGSQRMGGQDPLERRPPDRDLERASRRHPAALFSGGAGRLRRRQWRALMVVAVSVVSLTALFGFGLTRDPSAIRSALVNRRAPPVPLPTT